MSSKSTKQLCASKKSINVQLKIENYYIEPAMSSEFFKGVMEGYKKVLPLNFVHYANADVVRLAKLSDSEILH